MKFTPERKILIVLIYYMVLLVTALTALTLLTRDSQQFSTQLLGYFACEAFGHNPEMPCDPNTFRQYAHPEISAVALIFVAQFPTINLVYVVNIKELRELWRKARKPATYRIASAVSNQLHS